MKVYPYVLISTDPGRESEFLVPETEKDDGIYSNTYANNGDGTSWWVRIGDEEGYALDTNEIIALEEENLQFDSTNEKLQEHLSEIDLSKSIRQVRWVIRTEGFSDDSQTYTDAEAPRYYPVPKGFYMDVDADDAIDGRQDRSDVDPKSFGLKSLSKDIKDNGAHVAFMTQPNDPSITIALHNNHFASVILRSDDFKYAVSGNRASL